MNWLRFAALAALAALALPAEGEGDFRDLERPSTFLFMRIPLDGRSTKERTPVWGFALRGTRDYERLTLDSGMMTRFIDLGFVESKGLVVGAVAAAGAFIAMNAGKKSADNQNHEQQQRRQEPPPQQPQPCTRPPTEPRCP